MKKQATLFQTWDKKQPKPSTSKEVIFIDDDNEEQEGLIIKAMEEQEKICDASKIKNLAGFEIEAGSKWIYPTNYPMRDYQFSIVQEALYKNTMVILPTGLGKTFIAAVVMYNFYRWYPGGKIVFMAPTKPLVAQQIEACFKIMGIKQDDTIEMTGSLAPPERLLAWQNKRIFFLTPQVMINDLCRGTCEPESIKCLVVDEAHKATRNHAYCQVVKELLNYTKQFRILGLSASPGSDIQAVRQVLANLLISHVEIRSDDSPDIQPYTHTRQVQKIVIPLGEQLTQIKNKYINVITFYLQGLSRMGVTSIMCNPESLSKFKVLKLRDAFSQNPPTNISKSIFGKIIGDFSLCISLYHAYELLVLHGLRPFYKFLIGILQGEKSIPRVQTELLRNEQFQELLTDLESILKIKEKENNDLSLNIRTPVKRSDEEFIHGHPKLIKLQEIILDHFTKNEESSKVMIFSQYRDSVEEIAAMLRCHRPTVKVMSFIGQNNSSSKGLSQKQQIKVVKDFRQGGFNTLVSTCVGEEGLDIGEVDLIICYDAPKSPIRLIQRMGRTGRRREGKIVFLVTQGKEEQTYNQSLYSKNSIQKAITKGSIFNNLYSENPRMIPEGINPICSKLFMKVDEFQAPKMRRTLSPDKKNKTAFLNNSELDYWSSFLKPSQSTSMNNSSSFSQLNRHNNNRQVIYNRHLPYQRLLQTSHTIGHSKKTSTLVKTFEFIDLVASMDDSIAAFEMEMATFLNKEDVGDWPENDNLQISPPISVEIKEERATAKIIEPSTSTMLAANFRICSPPEINLVSPNSNEEISNTFLPPNFSFLDNDIASHVSFKKIVIPEIIFPLDKTILSPIKIEDIIEIITNSQSFNNIQNHILSSFNIEVPSAIDITQKDSYGLSKDTSKQPLKSDCLDLSFNEDNVNQVKIETALPSSESFSKALLLSPVLIEHGFNRKSLHSNVLKTSTPKAEPSNILRNKPFSSPSVNVIKTFDKAATGCEALKDLTLDVSNASNKSMLSVTQILDMVDNTQQSVNFELMFDLDRGNETDEDIIPPSPQLLKLNKQVTSLLQVSSHQSGTDPCTTKEVFNSTLSDGGSTLSHLLKQNNKLSPIEEQKSSPSGAEVSKEIFNSTFFDCDDLNLPTDSIKNNKSSHLDTPKSNRMFSNNLNESSEDESILKRPRKRLIHFLSSPDVSPVKKRHFSNDTDEDFMQNKSQNKNKRKKSSTNFNTKKRKGSNFIEDEANVSAAVSSDESENSSLNEWDSSFVDDEAVSQDMNQTEMLGVYLKSVKSPTYHNNRYKLQFNSSITDVYSQAVRPEESFYMNDSFCVDSATDIEIEDTPKLKKPKRHKRIKTIDSDEEVNEAKTSSFNSFSTMPINLEEPSTSDYQASQIIRPKKKFKQIIEEDDDEDFEVINTSSPKSDSRINLSCNPSLVNANTDFQNNFHLQSSVDEPTSSNTIPQSTFRTETSEINIHPQPENSVVNFDLNFEDDFFAEPPQHSVSVDPDLKADFEQSKIHQVETAEKHQKESNLLLILVDTREIAGGQLVVSSLRAHSSIDVMVAQLKAADYLLSSQVAVERMIYSDFSNMNNKSKIIDKARHMMSLYEQVFFVVEKDRVKKGNCPKVIFRSQYYDQMLVMLAFSGVQILHSENSDETSQLLVDLAFQGNKKNMSISPSHNEIKQFNEAIVNFYLSLPQVNYATALNLIFGFKSLHHFISSFTEENLQSIGKMGPQRAKMLCKFLNNKFVM